MTLGKKTIGYLLWITENQFVISKTRERIEKNHIFNLPFLYELYHRVAK